MKISAITVFPLSSERPELKVGKPIHPSWWGYDQALVKVDTDEGISGWGTAGTRWELADAARKVLTPHFIGDDALQPDAVTERVHQWTFWYGRGGTITNFVGAMNQALWDISGKHYGVPTHALLGGAVRDRIRVYAHWGIGSLTDEGKAAARERLDMLLKKGGYTAFKSGPGGKWRGHEPPSMIDDFVERAYLMREWVGPDVGTRVRLPWQNDPLARHRNLPRDQRHAANVRRGTGTAGERGRPEAGLGPCSFSYCYWRQKLYRSRC